MELKDRILEAMTHAKLKKTAFSRAMGMSSGVVTQWLDGTIKALKYETARKMQDVTGYSALWLADEQGEKMAIQQAAPPPTPDGLTPGAIEIAALYDLIPISDRIARVKAYNAATSAILAIARPSPSTVEPDPDQKTQSA